ncbi:hypothetical protein LUZ60_001735 [Juncus effusus]|nr:hypothetical protein LUZ60_001735 [Juncus effusus]
MESSASAREARRRKILERGSDRMRMITGAGSVNPPPPAGKPQGEAQPGGGSGDGDGDEIRNSAFIDDAGIIEGNTKISLIDSSKDREREKETLVDNQLTRNSSPIPKYEDIIKSKDEITLQNTEGNKSEQEIRREEPRISPNFAENRNYNAKSNPKWMISTPNEISQAVTNSEIIRLIFAIFFSFLVIKGFVTSKPLLILIITDITVIIGLLIANKDDKKKREKVKNYEMPVDKIGMSLEIGILAYKILGAIFMDTCIFAVIMICGLGI